MRKVLFVGDMQSPFIQQDRLIIQDFSDVQIVGSSRLRPIPHSISDIKSDISFMREIHDGIKRSDCAYIYFADCHAVPAILEAHRQGIKAVVIIGGWEVVGFRQYGYGAQLRPVRGRVARWTLQNADILVVPSESYKKRVTELGIPGEKIRVIPNCVPAELCTTPLPEKINVAVTAYFAQEMYRMKGMDRMPPDVWQIYRVPHNNLIDILRHVKVYCQISVTESFGVTLLESMACGCVPVVTDVDAMPEIIWDSGIVVDVDASTQDITQAINVAMTMDGTRAREQASRYSEERRKMHLEWLIKELCDDKNGLDLPRRDFGITGTDL